MLASFSAIAQACNVCSIYALHQTNDRCIACSHFWGQRWDIVSNFSSVEDFSLNKRSAALDKHNMESVVTLAPRNAHDFPNHNQSMAHSPTDASMRFPSNPGETPPDSKKHQSPSALVPASENARERVALPTPSPDGGEFISDIVKDKQRTASIPTISCLTDRGSLGVPLLHQTVSCHQSIADETLAKHISIFLGSCLIITHYYTFAVSPAHHNSFPCHTYVTGKKWASAKNDFSLLERQLEWLLHSVGLITNLPIAHLPRDAMTLLLSIREIPSPPRQAMIIHEKPANHGTARKVLPVSTEVSPRYCANITVKTA